MDNKIINIKTESVISAYDKLDYEEKKKIKNYSKILINGCSKLSENGAIELLGKIGMLLAKEDKNGQ